ncbi:MAG TPA: hypothetical protein VGL86_15070, partial [Polyangia bacterium]
EQVPAWVYFGSDPTVDGVFIPVAQVVTHPAFDPATLANDVALVVLARRVPVPTVAINRDALADADLGSVGTYV